MGINTNVNTPTINKSSFNNKPSYPKVETINFNTINTDVNASSSSKSSSQSKSYSTSNTIKNNNTVTSNISKKNSNVQTKKTNNYDKYNEYLDKATKAIKNDYNMSGVTYNNNYNMAKINYSNLDTEYMAKQNFKNVKSDMMNILGTKDEETVNNIADVVRYAQIKKNKVHYEYDEEEDFSFGSCLKDTCVGYYRGAKKVAKKGSATVANAWVGFSEGIAKFGETLVDTAALSGTGLISLVTAPIDIVRGTDFTDCMYDNTREFIAKRHVDDFYDDVYEDTKAGQWIKENSYASDTVRSVSSGIGYTTGVIITAACTGGTSLAADSAAFAAPSASTLGMTAFVGGVGKGSENAYNSGASTEEGALTGLANGTWEGFQFYIGGKIAGISPFTKEGANAALRIGLDTVDGASEGFVQPLISSIYQKGYYDKETGKYIEFDDDTSFISKYKHIWDEQGGLKQVGIQGATGFIMSSVGEVGNFRRAYAERKNSISTTLGNINEKIGFFESKTRGTQYYDRATVEHIDDGTKQFWINGINEQIRAGNDVTVRVSSTKELTSSIFENVDDLSKVKVEIAGGFSDGAGGFKPKYNQQRYIDRVTYTGYEAYEILKRMEGLEARIDKSLPTVRRARQIYELVADEYTQFGNTHELHYVSSSLRGMVPSNAQGYEGLVCAGYSQLYKELCERSGIRCEYIRGQGIQGAHVENHAWNMVFGDSNEMIPVDVTWKAGGGEYFGPTEKFWNQHKADANEKFVHYDWDLNKRSDIEYVIEQMDSKYGQGTGIQGLIGYVATGEENRITSQGGARHRIVDTPMNQILTYLDTMDRKTRINESIKYIKDECIARYGVEQGTLQVDDFLKTGNTNLITRHDGARTIAESLTIDDINFYNSGGTY